MTHVPGPSELALLALAAYRVYRLIARDTITEPARAAISYPDDQAVTLDSEIHVLPPAPPKPTPPGYEAHGLGFFPKGDRITVAPEHLLSKPLRVYVATLIRCPWCMGFYVSVAVWGAWMLWPRAALIGATPWAIAALVGLIAKNLDG